MNCPKCGAAMMQVEYAGVAVDRCAGCQGLWFDALELERLKQAKGAEALDTGDPQRGAELNQQGKIDCPRCHARMVPMVARPQRHIWYEQCSLCGGAFLDAGEFRDLKQRDLLDFFKSLMTPERE